MLLRIAHATQHAVDSLLTFTRLVRANLMHFRSIHDLVRTPHSPNTASNAAGK